MDKLVKLLALAGSDNDAEALGQLCVRRVGVSES